MPTTTRQSSFLHSVSSSALMLAATLYAPTALGQTVTLSGDATGNCSTALPVLTCGPSGNPYAGGIGVEVNNPGNATTRLEIGDGTNTVNVSGSSSAINSGSGIFFQATGTGTDNVILDIENNVTVQNNAAGSSNVVQVDSNSSGGLGIINAGTVTSQSASGNAIDAIISNQAAIGNLSANFLSTSNITAARRGFAGINTGTGGLQVTNNGTITGGTATSSDGIYVRQSSVAATGSLNVINTSTGVLNVRDINSAAINAATKGSNNVALTNQGTINANATSLAGGSGRGVTGTIESMTSTASITVTNA
ncbi:MAG: hypothetical protein AAFO70_05665, partial [Pseudomonadota bacterium]